MVENAFLETMLAKVLAAPTNSHPPCESPTKKILQIKMIEQTCV